jgi:two-component system NtrC family sensor kinase
MNTPVGFVASNFETLKRHVEKLQGLLQMYARLAEELRTCGPAPLGDRLAQIDDYYRAKKIAFVQEDLTDLFTESQEGLTRVMTVIQNLKDFSRIDQAEAFAEYDLNQGIQATLNVARNEVKYDADVKTELSPLPEMYCNSGQINQVILNILLNAAQAIKSQERDDRGTIFIRTYATASHTVCDISDDGPGIAPEILHKIFDPFFTTKPVGKGTGLGLSVSYDIVVNKHKGQLLVDSTVGKGTTFSIRLPLAAQPSEAAAVDETAIA